MVPASAPLTRAELRRRAGLRAPAVEAPGIPQSAPSIEIAAPEGAEERIEQVVEEIPVVTASTVVVEETATLAPEPADTGILHLADPAAAPPGDGAAEDAFEAAARLFSFTGETPVQATPAPAREADDDAAPSAVHTGPRHRAARGRRGVSAPAASRRPSTVRRVATIGFSIGVMGVVGLMAVGMTTPTQAVAAVNGTTAGGVQLAGDVGPGSGGIQAYVTSGQVQNLAVDRSGDYTIGSVAKTAAETGITNTSNFFTNNPDSPVQWPFAVGVPISYGFGMRDGVMHEGADFTPGEGADVQAIADGTVRIATESGGGYGVMVIIDHKIDGQLVSSRYGHMLYGSLKVKTGDTVKAGQVIGNTGNTGHSFGAHTHFEILINGTTAIDPIPWLRAHAGG